jgi:hypothetical protein
MEFTIKDKTIAQLTIAKLHNNAEAIKKYETQLAALEQPIITEISCDEIFNK